MGLIQRLFFRPTPFELALLSLEKAEESLEEARGWLEYYSALEGMYQTRIQRLGRLVERKERDETDH